MDILGRSLVIVSLVAWRRVAPFVSLIDELASFGIQALLVGVQLELGTITKEQVAWL